MVPVALKPVSLIYIDTVNRSVNNHNDVSQLAANWPADKTVENNTLGIHWHHVALTFTTHKTGGRVTRTRSTTTLRQTKQVGYIDYALNLAMFYIESIVVCIDVHESV